MDQPFDARLPKMGILEIDLQHKQLIACLDRLEHWIGKDNGFPAAIDAMQTLRAYTASHFSYEEAFLRGCGYPRLGQHIQEHRSICAELDRQSQLILTGSDVSLELVQLIRGWIIDHIGVEDLEYAAFFANKPPVDRK